MKIGLNKKIKLENKMKKLLVLATLLLSIMVSAQDKLTEGVIISKQTMASDNAEMQAQFATIGDMLTTTYFKDNKTRTEVSSPMTGDIITVTDMDSKETLVMMDNPMLGKKYMIQKHESNLEQLKSINVVKGDKTKTILGYVCQQYTVTLNNEGVDMDLEMYTTEALPVSSEQTQMLGDKLKGFPLYSTVKMNQMGSNMTITTEVTEIKKDAVPAEKLSLTPLAGYEKMEGQ